MLICVCVCGHREGVNHEPFDTKKRWMSIFRCVASLGCLASAAVADRRAAARAAADFMFQQNANLLKGCEPRVHLSTVSEPSVDWVFTTQNVHVSVRGHEICQVHLEL